LDREKINYHQYCILHAIPQEYFECVDGKWMDITADHEYFDSRYIPRNIWNHKCQTEPDEKQIKKNIKFVINLQRKGKIPIFLVYPLQTYLNQQKYSEERWKLVKELHRKKESEEIDYQKEWEEFNNKMDEYFSKVSNEIYEKRLGLSPHEDNKSQEEDNNGQ